MKYMLMHAVEESRLGNLPPQVEGELEAWARRWSVAASSSTGRGCSRPATPRPCGPSTATYHVTDGPFAETKEQVAGYDVIDCPDLDTAIAVASAHPTLHVGAIEVRAFDAGMPDPEVSETIADGKRRYLMLVCADMRRAMAREAAATPAADQASPDLWDPPEAGAAGRG